MAKIEGGLAAQPERKESDYTPCDASGRLNDQGADRFIAAGFSKELLLEVIAVVAVSTITNYTGSVTQPPVEAPFKAHVWSAD